MPNYRETITWVLQAENDLSASTDKAAASIREIGKQSDEARAKIKLLREEQAGLAKDSAAYQANAAEIKALNKTLDDNVAKTKAMREEQRAAAESSKVQERNLLGLASAVTTVTIGIGLAVTAFEKWISTAIEANKHLHDLGLDTGDAGKSIGRYGEAVDRLTTSFDQLFVTLSGPGFDRLTQVANVLDRLARNGQAHGGAGVIDLSVPIYAATGGLSAAAGSALAANGTPLPTQVGDFNVPIYGPLATDQQRLDFYHTKPTDPDARWSESNMYGPTPGQVSGAIGDRSSRNQWGETLTLDQRDALWRQGAANAESANIAMRGYYLSTAPGTNVAAGMGFLGASSINPYAGGSLGAGMSYNPMLSQPGAMGLQLPTQGLNFMQMASLVRAAPTGLPASVASLLAPQAGSPTNLATAFSGQTVTSSFGGASMSIDYQKLADTIADADKTPKKVTASGVAGFLGAAGSGSLGTLMSSLGPAGMVAGAVTSLAPHLGSTFDGLINQAGDLPGQLMRGIGHILLKLPDVITKTLPQIVTGFATLIPTLVDTLVVKLPVALALAIKDAIFGGSAETANALYAGNAAAQGHTGGAGLHGQALQQYLAVQAFQQGGGSTMRTRGGDAGGGVHVHLHGGSPQDQARATRKILGPYGLGFSLDPLVTGGG